jgi:hypothetical protein
MSFIHNYFIDISENSGFMLNKKFNNQELTELKKSSNTKEIK